MHALHLRDLDLNLLVALDALLSESHVTRAARAVGLSQSAMSHALNRLRDKLGDPLLVRTPRGMEQTARARALAAPLRAALLELDRAIAPPTPFDPKTARHTFRLGVSDYEELTLVRPLLRRLAQEAPGMDLLLRPSPPSQWAEQLAGGELDLVTRPAGLQEDDSLEGLYFKRALVKDRFVVVARKGNPHTAGRLTLKRYLEAPHALVAPGGTARGMVDDLLEERGLSRRVALVVPHFLVAPHFVADSDLLLTLAERVAHTYAPLLDLELHPLPFPLPGFAIHAFWHARLQHDPGQRFLRGLLFEVARGHAEGLRSSRRGG